MKGRWNDWKNRQISIFLWRWRARPRWLKWYKLWPWWKFLAIHFFWKSFKKGWTFQEAIRIIPISAVLVRRARHYFGDNQLAEDFLHSRPKS